MTKEKLLATNCFIDNEYLDQYLELVNSSTTGTEVHHILPRSYFKELEIKIDNSDDNLVKLSFADHCKAHWLLYYCTIGKLKKASQASFILMTKAFLKTDSIADSVDYNLLQQKWEEFKNDSSTDFFSTDEEQFIIQNYNKLSHKQLALKLNRTARSICQKATLLGLRTKQPNWWSKEEKQYLIDNFGKKTLVEIAKEIGRSYSSVRKMTEILQINVQRDYWTTDEINFVKENYSKLGMVGCAEKLNRTPRAVQFKATTLGLYFEYGTKIYCSELDKSWTSIKAAADELNIAVSLIHRCIIGKQKQTHGYHFKKI